MIQSVINYLFKYYLRAFAQKYNKLFAQCNITLRVDVVCFCIPILSIKLNQFYFFLMTGQRTANLDQFIVS